MIVLEVCVVVVLVGLTAAAVLGKFGGDWSDPVSSHRHDQLPEGDLARDDLLALRFDQGLRGYRMDQVDAVITRLTEELEDRDRRIASLRGEAQGRAGGSDESSDHAEPDATGAESGERE